MFFHSYVIGKPGNRSKDRTPTESTEMKELHYMGYQGNQGLRFRFVDSGNIKSCTPLVHVAFQNRGIGGGGVNPLNCAFIRYNAQSIIFSILHACIRREL